MADINIRPLGDIAMNRFSLKQKAIFFACAIGILPMLTLGTASYIATDRQTNQQQITAQQERAKSLNNTLKRFLYERYSDTQVLSKLSMLTNVKVRNTLPVADKRAVLDHYAQVYDVYDSIAAFDTEGNVIVQSTGAPLENHKGRVYFDNVLKTDLPGISSPQISKSSGEMVIFFAAPIKDSETGKTTGVVRTRMPLQRLYSFLTDGAAQNDAWFLTDAASGKVFSALNRSQIGQQIEANFPGFSSKKGIDNTQTLITHNRMNGNQDLVTLMPVGYFQGLPKLDWNIVMATNTSSAFAVQRILLLTLIFGVIATGGIVGSLAFLFARQTTSVIEEVSKTISISSSEIAATVEQQERTIQEQAEAVSQTTVTMDELGATSRQSAEQAQASAAGAKQVLSLANDGTQVVQQTITGMATLKEKVEAIENQITSLSEQATQIGSISGLVKDLAQKTNTLALNAAVEAARAGEHGQGFSIVAREVRKLADQSKLSATEINTLVSEIQTAIKRTVIVTDEGAKTVDLGLKLAEDTAEAFAGVASAVSGVVQNSEQISMSAKHQAVAVQQVVSNINALNIGAQESATGMNQVRVTTQELSAAAQELSVLV